MNGGRVSRVCLLVAVFAGAGGGALAEAFRVTAAANVPTLVPGDVVVSRAVAELARGRFILFADPAGTGGPPHLFRIVGLAGDSVAMRGGVLVLNGVAASLEGGPVLEMPPNDHEGRCATGAAPGGPCLVPTARQRHPDLPTHDVADLGASPLDDMKTVVVPEGHVFVLGDNRDDARDSRQPRSIGGPGIVPVEHILGRAIGSPYNVQTGRAGWVALP